MIRNANKEHKDSLTFNERIGLKITNAVGTMWCAYVFGALALISLPEAIMGGTATVISWIAQTFLQLVLLSIIMVGQNVQAKHAELLAEATYEADMKTEKDIKKMMKFLEKKHAR